MRRANRISRIQKIFTADERQFLIDSPTVGRNTSGTHLRPLIRPHFAAPHIFRIASRLFSTIPIVPIYLLHPFFFFFFFSLTFYPLYTHTHTRIHRERREKKEKNIHFPTGEINRDPRALRRRSLPFRLFPPLLVRMKALGNSYPPPSPLSLIPRDSIQKHGGGGGGGDATTQCRMTNEL